MACRSAIYDVESTAWGRAIQSPGARPLGEPAALHISVRFKYSSVWSVPAEAEGQFGGLKIIDLIGQGAVL